MKAWFTVPGPEGATRELRDIPVPTPSSGQVVVAVRARAGHEDGSRGAEREPTESRAAAVLHEVEQASLRGGAALPLPRSGTQRSRVSRTEKIGAILQPTEPFA